MRGRRAGTNDGSGGGAALSRLLAATLVSGLGLGLASSPAFAVPDGVAGDAREALRRAVEYLRREVSVEGSYLWEYSEDLTERRGEGRATATQGWVQPPGTPAAGRAFLRAHEATGEDIHLDAARETAHALARTQLVSGGWDYRIEFAPDERRRWLYRVDVRDAERDAARRRNTSTYDDDTTQSAIRFLVAYDLRVAGKDALARSAVEYALAKLLESQYPNGAWPQRWSGERWSEDEYPVLDARYPESWSRTYPREDYRKHYTFNDGAIRDIIRTLLEAHRAYGREEHLEAARRGGDFILRAQMPEPQPVWAQQYNARMEPAWARKFEPPSVVSSESLGVLRALLDLHLHTGEERWLEPIEPAIEWFRRSRLPDGRWARFYELRTNRPLYFNREYELVYTPGDLPTHYSFRGAYSVDGIRRAYEEVRRLGREACLEKTRGGGEGRRGEEKEEALGPLAPRVRKIIELQDERGRWVEDGRLRMRTFNRNLETLARYVELAGGRD